MYMWPSGAVYRGEWKDGSMHGAPLCGCWGQHPASSLSCEAHFRIMCPVSRLHDISLSTAMGQASLVSMRLRGHVLCALGAGTGTMQGPDGSVFTGGWQKDVKFGLGRKVYANGDVYEVSTPPAQGAGSRDEE